MIASAQAFRNGPRRASGEWVCLRLRDSGSIGCSGEGEHGVRPYANVVGASDPARKVHGLGQDDSMFALRSDHEFQEVT